MTTQEFRKIGNKLIEVFPVSATFNFDVRIEFDTPEGVFVTEGEYNIPVYGSPEELGDMAKCLQELLAEPIIVSTKTSEVEE